MEDFPRDPAELTSEWLTAKLTSTGVLTDGVEVESLSWEPIGDGRVGTMFRVELSYGGTGGSTPRSLAAKFASKHDPVREMARVLRAYEREITVYRDIISGGVDGSGINAPKCYGTDFDPETNTFVLLFEDGRDAEPGDVFAGCSAERTELVFRSYARMHAIWLEHPGVVSNELFTLGDRAATTIGAMLEDAIPRAREIVRPWMSDAALEIYPRLTDHFGRLQAYARSGPGRTLTHGDAQVANVLFPADGEPVIIDWQFAAAGRGVDDLARFVLVSMNAEERKAPSPAGIHRRSG